MDIKIKSIPENDGGGFMAYTDKYRWGVIGDGETPQKAINSFMKALTYFTKRRRMEKFKRVVIIQGDDWEGIFIDGNLHDEGHVLGEDSNKLYIIKLAEEKGFTYSDIQIIETSLLDDEYLDGAGGFQGNIMDMPGIKNGDYDE